MISAILLFLCYSIFLIVIIKIIIEKYEYNEKYYREFPSEDNPYVLEYLMKRKITNLSFSATILNLIAKKVIKVEKNADEDIQLIRVDTSMSTKTEAEAIVLNILFDIIGKDNKCSVNNIELYSKTKSKAYVLDRKIRQFKKNAKLEAKNKNYFKADSSIVFFNTVIGINYIVTICMTIRIFKDISNAKNMIIYLELIIISAIYYIIVKKYKNRTDKGKLEYSKWLAHKRYLKDFSNFEEKDLPEIILWEKYLVTATILGSASKVESKMKLYINNYDISTSNLLLAINLNDNFIKTINKSINIAIIRAYYTDSLKPSSSYYY